MISKTLYFLVSGVSSFFPFWLRVPLCEKRLIKVPDFAKPAPPAPWAPEGLIEFSAASKELVLQLLLRNVTPEEARKPFLAHLAPIVKSFFNLYTWYTSTHLNPHPYLSHVLPNSASAAQMRKPCVL